MFDIIELVKWVFVEIGYILASIFILLAPMLLLNMMLDIFILLYNLLP